MHTYIASPGKILPGAHRGGSMYIFGIGGSHDVSDGPMLVVGYWAGPLILEDCYRYPIHPDSLRRPGFRCIRESSNDAGRGHDARSSCAACLPPFLASLFPTTDPLVRFLPRSIDGSAFARMTSPVR